MTTINKIIQLVKNGDTKKAYKLTKTNNIEMVEISNELEKSFDKEFGHENNFDPFTRKGGYSDKANKAYSNIKEYRLRFKHDTTYIGSNVDLDYTSLI